MIRISPKIHLQFMKRVLWPRCITPERWLFLGNALPPSKNPVCPVAGQLASAEWWETRGLTVPRAPPEAALTDVVRDLFAAMALPPSFGGGGSGGGFGSTLGLASLSTGGAWPAAMTRPPQLLCSILKLRHNRRSHLNRVFL